MKYAIALTGGISTGKSTVGNLLKLYGFDIIDADKIAHQILNTQYKNIIEIFGKQYVIDGVVDRKSLGALIFSDKNAKKKLEELLHPLIREEILKQTKKMEEKKIHYFIDIPLFFETNSYKDIKRVLVVYATKELQLKRLMQRDGFSKDEALKRIKSQISIEQKKEQATDIIHNTKDINYLVSQVEEFYRGIK